MPGVAMRGTARALRRGKDTNDAMPSGARQCQARHGNARAPSGAERTIMARTKKMKLADLVFDFELYPRAQVDSQHVGQIAEAIAAGAELPPIVIDKKTKRVVDGFHRGRAYRRLFGDNADIEVEEREYGTDAEMFIAAMVYNAGHGRNLTTFDRTHCIIRAERLKIEPAEIASALNLTVDRIGTLHTSRVGHLKSRRGRGNGAVSVPLKRTIAHMAGRTLTKQQSATNQKLGGMNQAFYVNQLILLIENELLDTDNDELMGRLNKLHSLLDSVCASA